MQKYDDIEEKVLELVWAHSPKEGAFMVAFMSRVFSVAEHKFSIQQKEIFSKIMQPLSIETQPDRYAIKKLIEQNHHNVFELKGGEIVKFTSRSFYSHSMN